MRFLLLILATDFAAHMNGGPPANPQGPNPPLHHANGHQHVNNLAALDVNQNAFQTLFRSCFTAHNRPTSDLFTVWGVDASRYVQISFQVSSGMQNCCILEWKVDRLVVAAESIPSLAGGITSINIADHIPSPLLNPGYLHRGITLTFCGGHTPTISLNVFEPNGMVSGRMIRSFITKSMNALDDFYEQFAAVEDPPSTMVEVQDHSNFRELFFLENGNGNTYFQQWGLEYDCISALGGAEVTRWRTISHQAFLFPVNIAFDDDNFEEIISPHGFGETYQFHPVFIQVIRDYRDTLSEQQRIDMTIR